LRDSAADIDPIVKVTVFKGKIEITDIDVWLPPASDPAVQDALLSAVRRVDRSVPSVAGIAEVAGNRVYAVPHFVCTLGSGK
jgi:hypothetical protein